MKSNRVEQCPPAVATRRAERSIPTSTPVEPGTSKLAASYARKSNANDQALKGQHEVNRQRALADGFHIPEDAEFLFEDDGTSGRITDRSGLTRFLELAQAGKARFSRVYVRDLSRLTRHDDPRYFSHFTYDLKQHNIVLCDSSREHSVIDYDLAGSELTLGSFLADQVQAVNGALELQKIKSRIRQGIRHGLRRGCYPSGHAPFGTQRYIVDRRTGEYIADLPERGSLRLPNGEYKLRWDPSLTSAIRQIFDACEDGESAHAIAMMLNLMGVPTVGPARAGKATLPRWTTRSVNGVLRNPIYTGTLKWGHRIYVGLEAPSIDDVKIDGKGPVTVEGFMPDPPITAEQWARAQEVLRKRTEKHCDSPRPGRPPFLLTGLLRCTSCQGTFHGMSSKVGRCRRYYRHGRQPIAYEGQCPHAHRYLDASMLESSVLGLIADLVRDERLQGLVKKHVEKLLAVASTPARARELLALRAQLAKLDAAAARAAENAARAEDAEQQQAYRAALRTVSEQLSQLRQRVSAVEQEETSLKQLQDRAAAVAAKLGDRRKLVESANPAERKKLVHAMVTGLRIDPGAHVMVATVIAA